MTGQHAAQHHEVCAAPEGFCHVARHGTAAVTDDLAAETVGSIGTLNHRRELRIADAGFHSGGADGAWADADLDDVCPGEDQLFTHFACHYVTGANGFIRPCRTRFSHELHEVLGVTISHVNTDKAQRRAGVEDLFSLFKISVGGTG